jgi:hypothetical protein
MISQGAVVNGKRFKSTAKAIALAVGFSASAGTFALAADMPVKAPPPAAAPAPFFFVNDTSVSFTYFFNATDPGVRGSAGTIQGGIPGTQSTISRLSGSVDHFDVWEYGSNIFHIEMNQYGKNDPTNGIAGAAGSTEVVGFGHSTISWNALTHSKLFTNPVFRYLGWSFGGFAAGENDQLAPDDRQIDLGLAINFNLPGVVILNVWAQKEWNHNSFLSCNGQGGAMFACAAGTPAGAQFSGDREWGWVPKLDLFVSEPLKFITAIPVTFISITDVTFPKGTGVSTANIAATVGPGAPILPFNGNFAQNLANAETKTEIFQDAQLRFDTGKVTMGKPGIWDTYVGYRYWYNKFGTDHSAPLFSALGAQGSSIEKTVYHGTTYHYK